MGVQRAIPSNFMRDLSRGSVGSSNYVIRICTIRVSDKSHNPRVSPCVLSREKCTVSGDSQSPFGSIKNSGKNWTKREDKVNEGLTDVREVGTLPISSYDCEDSILRDNTERGRSRFVSVPPRPFSYVSKDEATKNKTKKEKTVHPGEVPRRQVIPSLTVIPERV